MESFMLAQHHSRVAEQQKMNNPGGSAGQSDEDQLRVFNSDSGAIERSCRRIFAKHPNYIALDKNDAFVEQLKRAAAREYAEQVKASERARRLRDQLKRPVLNTWDDDFQPSFDEDDVVEDEEEDFVPTTTAHKDPFVELVSEDELILQQVLAMSLLETEHKAVVALEEPLVFGASVPDATQESDEEEAFSLVTGGEQEEDVKSTATWTDAEEDTASEWSACDQHLSFRHAVLASSSTAALSSSSSSSAFGAPVRISAPRAGEQFTVMNRNKHRSGGKDGLDTSAVDFEGRYLEWKSDNKHTKPKRKCMNRRSRFH